MKIKAFLFSLLFGSTCFAQTISLPCDIIYNNQCVITLAPGSGVTFTVLNEQLTISAPASGGTVTSVGLADGSTVPIFGITNSPVTTSGTLTETLVNQSANTVFAGPTSGGSAQPKFRTLVAADIPSGLTPGGAAGGDLSGTYPNPSVATVGGASAANVASTVTEVAAALSADLTGNTLVQRSSGAAAFGSLSVGTSSSPGAIFEIGGAPTASLGLQGLVLNESNIYFTDSSSPSGGFPFSAYFNTIGLTELAAQNTNVTTTNAASLVIDGSVRAETNETITNSYGIDILSTSVAPNGSVTNSYGLSVGAMTGATNNYAAVFTGGNVGVGTSSPYQLFQVVGHVAPLGPAPTISSCGGGTIAAGSSDNRGYITGITAATACTITFYSTLPTGAACVFSNSAATAVGVSSMTTSAVTSTMTALTGTLYYICF